MGHTHQHPFKCPNSSHQDSRNALSPHFTEQLTGYGGFRGKGPYPRHLTACLFAKEKSHKEKKTVTDCAVGAARRYIYLWIKYAIFEELDAGDVGRAREVYRAALKLVPHHIFTFSKQPVDQSRRRDLWLPCFSAHELVPLNMHPFVLGKIVLGFERVWTRAWMRATYTSLARPTSCLMNPVDPVLEVEQSVYHSNRGEPGGSAAGLTSSWCCTTYPPTRRVLVVLRERQRGLSVCQFFLQLEASYKTYRVCGCPKINCRALRSCGDVL
eukprot:1157757-Pelagomonas_calceolata.AAC.17